MASIFSQWKNNLNRLARGVSQKIKRGPSDSTKTRLLQIIQSFSAHLKKFIEKKGASFYGKILTTVLCAYFLSDLTSLLVNQFIPDPPTIRGSLSSHNQKFTNRQGIDAYQSIFSRNLFNSKGLIPGRGDPIGTDGINGPAVKTTLPLKLIGTLILEDERYSIATVQDKNANRTYPVREGEQIMQLIKIEQVRSSKVTFINLRNRRREYIELPKDFENTPILKSSGVSAKIEQISSKRFAISRNEIDKSLGNLNQILTQARAIPHFENGSPSGYKLFQIVPGSIYDQLGLKNGDVIKGFNGQSIKDPSQAFEMLNDLKNLSNVELNVQRNGMDSNLIYDIN